MAMPPDMEIDIGMPFPAPTANFAKLLELATKGDLLQFQAQMVKYPLDFTAGPDVYHNRTSLHMAALHGQAEIVKCIISSPDMSVQIANASDRFGYTPLHLAVRSQHETIVRILIKSLLMLPDRVLAATGELDELGEDCDGFTPLHLAAAGGNLPIVKLLLQQSGIRGGLTANDIPVNIHTTTWQGLTALDIAKQRKHVELVKRLESFDVNWLELERQKSANSVNAILVGAALVGTVAFGCWQQPPLGIPAWDHSPTANVTVLTAQQNQARMNQAQQQVQLGWFFMCISVSFSCSVVSLVIGTAASIPSGRGMSLKREVRNLRRSALRASIFLFLAIFFLMISFQLSGLLVFDAVTPPGTAMHSVGRYVLLAFPFLNCAYILRYVVLPKGLYRGKTWVLLLFFIMASGLMMGIGFFVSYTIIFDTRRFNVH